MLMQALERIDQGVEQTPDAPGLQRLSGCQLIPQVSPRNVLHDQERSVVNDPVRSKIVAMFG